MFYADESDTGARAERRAPVEDPRHPDPVFGAPDPMSVSAALDDETRSIDHSWIGLSSDIDPTEEPARESALEPDTDTAVPPERQALRGERPLRPSTIVTQSWNVSTMPAITLECWRWRVRPSAPRTASVLLQLAALSSGWPLK